MLLSEGLEFLKKFKPLKEAPEIWADLGSGDGFFTYVLAEKLRPGSSIYAVDKAPQKLIHETNGVSIHFQQLDFIKDKLTFPKLDC